MPTLAKELLHLIVSQVALDYVYYPDEKCVRKDLGTLRSLRLANKDLCDVASEYLFEEVTLYFTEASHAKMTAIAQHPTYSTCVRTIGIAPKAIFGPFLNRNEFGKWFQHERSLVTGPGYSEGCFMKPHRMAYLRTGEPSVIDFHHAKYASLYKKQEHLFAKVGDLLKTAIGCFSRLEQVETSVRTPPTAYRTPSTDDAFISDIWQRSACLHKYDLEHSVKILTAVSQGRSLAATQLDISQIFYKMDIMVMDVREPIARGQIRGLFADVKNLKLSIQTFNTTGLQRLLNTGKCAKFLASMKKLESFACSSFELEYSPHPYPTIPIIFGNNTWQHLRCLELSRFHTFATNLSKLLHRHKSTLQELALQHVLLRKGSWHEVFVKLQGTAIEIVKVHHLGCGMLPHNFFEDIDENDFMSPITASHPLSKFLFDGAPWVTHMEDVLEGLGSDFGDSDLEDIVSEEDWEDSEEHMSDQ